MTALKFPGGTILFYGAHFFLPAWLPALLFTSLIYQQKIEMPLYMSWYRSPTLLIAMDSLQRHAEEFSQFFLGFAKLFPG